MNDLKRYENTSLIEILQMIDYYCCIRFITKHIRPNNENWLTHFLLRLIYALSDYGIIDSRIVISRHNLDYNAEYRSLYKEFESITYHPETILYLVDKYSLSSEVGNIYNNLTLHQKIGLTKNFDEFKNHVQKLALEAHDSVAKMNHSYVPNSSSDADYLNTRMNVSYEGIVRYYPSDLQAFIKKQNPDSIQFNLISSH